MSELKWNWVYYPYLDPPEKQKESALKAGYNKVYLKSEVDKVIAELKADYKEACGRLQTANLIKDEQLTATRHQKYKRCLAMVKYCEYRFMNLEKMIDTEYRTKKLRFSHRWWVKWLKLADKFKESK